MTRLKDLLDREASRIDAEVDALDSVLRTRDRRQRTRHIRAAVLALLIFAASITWLATQVVVGRSTPADPEPAPLHGLVAVRDARTIVQIDLATGEEVPWPVAGPRFSHYFPVLEWSPDGSQLVYATSYKWTGKLQVFDVATGRIRTATSCNGLCFARWSPDGSTIAVARWVPQAGPGHTSTEVDLMDASGGHIRRIFADEGSIATTSSPSWTPDSHRILFAFAASSPDPVSLLSVGRTGSDLITLGADQTGQLMFPVSWSPDTTRLAYFTKRQRTDSPIELVVANRDGSDPTVVLSDAGRCCPDHTTEAEGVAHSTSLSWSPDGTQLALVIHPPGQPQGLYVMNADGTDLRLVREGVTGQPAWRPEP